MRMLTLSAVILLGGCSTVSGLITNFTDVSCKKQVDLAETAISTTGKSVAAAFGAKAISFEDKNKITQELINMNKELFVLNNDCETQPEKAKADALKIMNDAASKEIK